MAELARLGKLAVLAILALVLALIITHLSNVSSFFPVSVIFALILGLEWLLPREFQLKLGMDLERWQARIIGMIARGIESLIIFVVVFMLYFILKSESFALAYIIPEFKLFICTRISTWNFVAYQRAS